MKFNQTASTGFTMTTSAGTFSESANQATSSFSATCPNGSTFAASGASAFALLSCDGGLNIFPGTEESNSNTSVTLMLLGTGNASPLSVFDCTM